MPERFDPPQQPAPQPLSLRLFINATTITALTCLLSMQLGGPLVMLLVLWFGVLVVPGSLLAALVLVGISAATHRPSFRRALSLLLGFALGFTLVWLSVLGLFHVHPPFGD